MTDTKERIIRTAEVLFARDGYAGTSLRNITDEADVNVAAVNYHFGSKENLLIEILDRIVIPINDDRLRLLGQIDQDENPDLEQVLTAFLLPDLKSIHELRERDPALTRFVSRMYTEGSELMGQIMGRQFAEVQRRFYQALGRALPHLTADDIAWRLHCVVGIVIYLFASAAGTGMPKMVGQNIDEDLRKLLDITVAIMTAPSQGGDASVS